MPGRPDSESGYVELTTGGVQTSGGRTPGSPELNAVLSGRVREDDRHGRSQL